MKKERIITLYKEPSIKLNMIVIVVLALLPLTEVLAQAGKPITIDTFVRVESDTRMGWYIKIYRTKLLNSSCL